MTQYDIPGYPEYVTIARDGSAARAGPPSAVSRPPHRRPLSCERGRAASIAGSTTVSEIIGYHQHMQVGRKRSSMGHYSAITGWGMYVPEKILTNADLERIVDTSDEWITSRTGIKQRHVAAPGENGLDALDRGRPPGAGARRYRRQRPRPHHHRDGLPRLSLPLDRQSRAARARRALWRLRHAGGVQRLPLRRLGRASVHRQWQREACAGRSASRCSRG